jgi:putative peptidoglycan lipid II flippase
LAELPFLLRQIYTRIYAILFYREEIFPSNSFKWESPEMTYAPFQISQQIQKNRVNSANEANSHFDRVSRATLILIAAAILGRLITLLFQMAIANQFGNSIYSDAYFVVEVIPELFLGLISLGISTVFIPMYTKVRIMSGESGAHKFASSFFFLSVIISLIIMASTIACSSYLVAILAPGFSREGAEIATSLIHIIGVAAIFMGVSAFSRGLLNSHKEFIIPELSRLVYNLILLAFALMLVSRFGIFALGWGVVIGALFMCIIQFVGVKHFRGFRPVFPYDRRIMKGTAKRIFLCVTAFAGVEGIFVINRMVASGLEEGSIATLSYAARMILLPVGFFALPLRTVIFPTLSELTAKRQFADVENTVLSGLKALFFFVIPACIGLAVLSVPLTSLIFERGAFGHSATLATSRAIVFYAAGVPAIAAYFYFQNVFFSLDDAWTVIKINIFSWSLNLVLNLILSGYFGYQGIALGTALAMNITAIVMVFNLRRHKLESLDVKGLLNSLGRIVVASALMGLSLILMPEKLGIVLNQMKLNYELLHLISLILIGSFLYLAIGWALRFDEWGPVLNGLRRFGGIRGIRKK